MYLHICGSKHVCCSTLVAEGGIGIFADTGFKHTVPVNCTTSQHRAHERPVLTLRHTNQSRRNLVVVCKCWQSVLQQVRTGIVVGGN